MIENKLKSGNSKLYCQNRMVFTENGIFKVPEGVTQLFISGCAAGGKNQYSCKAGDFCIDKVIRVTPKELIEITVGQGNTLIGNYKTLIANSFGDSFENNKLGYTTGQKKELHGPSGAFGFGGGNGGVIRYYAQTYTYPPGSGFGALIGEVVNSQGGTIYGSKGGTSTTGSSSIGSGGAAGGYGAGGGSKGEYSSGSSSYYGKEHGDCSPGIAIIEW